MRIKRSLVVAFLVIILASACMEKQAIQPTVNEEKILTTSEENHSSNKTVLNGKTINPQDMEYIGAFRLPGEWDPPDTFAYGGNAMTYNPNGDSGNADHFPGSLFIMGHDRLAYGDLPNGNKVAEINIPEPLISKSIENLNSAAFIQDFSDVTAGFFTDLEEIPKVGLQYLDHPATGPKIHISWGQHLQPPGIASHGWFDPDLDNPQFEGAWFIGNQDLYSTNGYMLEIPSDWALKNTNGKLLGTGRMRDGGQGGMGPTLFAYRPWQEDGSPKPSGTHLEETVLLLYENVYSTPNIEKAMDGYQHPDEWEGGAWLTTPEGKSSVIFVGTKANGEKYWYGYMHPDGPQEVCVDDHVSDFPICRLADGSVCPDSDLIGCCHEEDENCVSMRGWWSTRFDASILFYDPADFSKVAAGEMESWEPQPYAILDIDEFLFLNPPEWDFAMLGWGDQRRYRIGDAAFDYQNGYLYILELFTDDAKPVVHVWQL